jgi:hypothetical protein
MPCIEQRQHKHDLRRLPQRLLIVSASRNAEWRSSSYDCLRASFRPRRVLAMAQLP